MVSRNNIPEYSVSEFNKILKDTIESNFDFVKIRGEISEIKTATKGQLYLTIKDDDSILSGVIWASKINFLSIKPEIGMDVKVFGKITTWSRYKTTYQIDIDNLEIAGEGTLLKLFEERKKRLEAKGLFEKKYKKTIPYIPNKIGVITSPTGAVIYDIINRLNERFPLEVELWPTAVQGEEAAEMIISAIKGFNGDFYKEKPDVIIIARGGGSLEDLMVFNNEKLAYAVFESNIPIISAIGHETDTTIIDFISDLKAPTPTAAAEMCVPVRKNLISDLTSWSNRLFNAIENKIYSSNNLINTYTRLLKDPKFVIDNYKEKLFLLNKDFFNSFKYFFEIRKNKLYNNFIKLKNPNEIYNLKKIKTINLLKKLEIIFMKKVKNNIISLKNINRLLKSNSVDHNLKKGYVFIKKSNKIIKRGKKLNKNDKILINFIDKKINAKIN